MKKTPDAGKMVVHVHDKKNWRLRNTKHILDPNWERGIYCKCHEPMRNTIKRNTWIFDVIWISAGTYPFIRSAFEIISRKGDTLHFDKFWFNDGALLAITPKIVKDIKKGPYPTKYGKGLSKEECRKLLKYMKMNSCNEYEKGKKPKSINLSDWRKMKREATERIGKKHSCQLDKRIFIPKKSIISLG